MRRIQQQAAGSAAQNRFCRIGKQTGIIFIGTANSEIRLFKDGAGFRNHCIGRGRRRTADGQLCPRMQFIGINRTFNSQITADIFISGHMQISGYFGIGININRSIGNTCFISPGAAVIFYRQSAVGCRKGIAEF